MYNLPEGWKLLTYTPDELDRIWELIKDYDSIFVDDRMKSKEIYLAQFLKPNTVVLETSGGIVILTDIDPGLKATFHPVFWDHKLSARLKDLEALIIWAFLYFDLYRLQTTVAPYARAAIRFLEGKLKFTYEGTLRNYVKKNSQPLGMKVYSITREEVI